MKKLLTFLLFLSALSGLSQSIPNKWSASLGTNTYTASVTGLVSSACVGGSSPYCQAVVFVTFTEPNSGASTLAVNGLTARAIRKWDGDSWEALVNGDIKDNDHCILTYSTPGNYWEMFTLQPSIGGGTQDLQSVLDEGSTATIGNPFNVSTSNSVTIETTGTGTPLQILSSEGGTVTLNDNASVSGAGVVVTGTSAEISLSSPAGFVKISGSTTKAGELRIEEDADNGSNYVGFIAPALLAGNTGYTLPTALPAVTGYVLSATDAGVMSWIASGGGGDALTSNPLSQFAATTSAQLAGVLTNETGSGLAVFATSPVFTTPNIGSATGSVSGNAGTATALATPRTIGTVTGDATSAGSSFDGSANNTNALTLATVNGNVGSFGSSTAIPVITLNAKGLATAATTAAVVAPAGTLTGTTLAATVVTSSLTALGTIATGVWNGTPVVTTYGGTGVSSWTGGDVPYYASGTALSKLAKGTAGQVMWMNSGATAPEWTSPSVGSALTDVDDTNVILSQSGSSVPLVNAMTLTVSWSGQLSTGRGGTGADNSTQTYTPTLTNSANIAASTARQCTYYRVGNVVTVAGQLDIDPTTTLTQTTMGISLPVASNFTTAFQGGGTAAATTVTDNPAGIISDATNDRVTLSYICVDVTNHTLTFSFTYQVL